MSTLASLTAALFLASAPAAAEDPPQTLSSLADCATLTKNGEIIRSGTVVDRAQAKLCRLQRSLILYPVLRDDGAAVMTAYQGSESEANEPPSDRVPQGALKNWRTYQQAVARYAPDPDRKDEAPRPAPGRPASGDDAFPKETRDTVNALFDKGQVAPPPVAVGPQLPPAAVTPCGPANGPAAKGTNMDNALVRICSNSDAKNTINTTYTVPAGVDCKTGEISWTPNADRGTAMTAINSFYNARSVCTNAHYARAINRGDAIGTVNGRNKVGALAGDHSATMASAQRMLNALMGGLNKSPGADPAIPGASAPLKPLKVDGMRGDDTRNALVTFQAANHLPQTGVLDAATLQTLNAQYAAADPTPQRFRGQFAKMKAQDVPLPGQRPDEIASATPAQLKALTPSQVGALNAAQFGRLNADAFAPGSKLTTAAQKAAYEKRKKELADLAALSY